MPRYTPAIRAAYTADGHVYNRLAAWFSLAAFVPMQITVGGVFLGAGFAILPAAVVATALAALCGSTWVAASNFQSAADDPPRFDFEEVELFSPLRWSSTLSALRILGSPFEALARDSLNAGMALGAATRSIERLEGMRQEAAAAGRAELVRQHATAVERNLKSAARALWRAEESIRIGFGYMVGFGAVPPVLRERNDLLETWRLYGYQFVDNVRRDLGVDVDRADANFNIGAKSSRDIQDWLIRLPSELDVPATIAVEATTVLRNTVNLLSVPRAAVNLSELV